MMEESPYVYSDLFRLDFILVFHAIGLVVLNGWIVLLYGLMLLIFVEEGSN